MIGESNKIQYLVVDTSAFIRNAALQDVGVNILTEQDVVDEIKSKRQLRRLVVLPYDLKVQHADPEDIKLVTEFSKKTGDYISLSATDIKVIALTYKLEKEHVGTEHLRTAPVIRKTVDSSVKQPDDHPKLIAGFYMPEGSDEQEEEKQLSTTDKNIEKIQELLKANPEGTKAETESAKQDEPKENAKEESESVKEQEEASTPFVSEPEPSESDYETAESDTEWSGETNDLSEKFAKLACEPTELEIEGRSEHEHDVDDILASVKESDPEDPENYDGENEDDDDSGWITPRNIKNVKKQMDNDILEEKPAVVACMTMDFAMQNVLMQMGLNVAALDGRVIKQMRTFIFRCYACFKTTSVMTKIFCPNCGNKTLKKVEISLDDEGKQQLRINFRRPLSAKGKRFPLPMPKGGKHADNPILFEDQPIPDQRPSKLARMKNDPLQEDYIAGYSPFIMRDVNSKSALLGIRPGGSVKYWMKKNPNESRKKRK